MTNRPIFQKKDLKRTQLLYQIVQDEIKAYIIQNSLLPGDSLPPETELCELLGVSRNSVREAVKSLETLGILEARPGAGLYVSNFSFDPLLQQLGYGILFDHKQLTDIIDVRFHLEHGMIDRAVRAATPEQVAQLQAILDEMRNAAENGHYSAEADRDFHRVLWANVDNTIVGKILDVFWVIFRQAQARSAIPDPPQPLATYQRHVPIVEALAQQDVEAARLAMERHYIGIQERLAQIKAGPINGHTGNGRNASGAGKPPIN
ncbi:MAG: FadR family transcriptional regulator [Caldilinea sp. CFX5]|nr:FadR family transcriptional regulator [Caldilinea sp. CFX5]